MNGCFAGWYEFYKGASWGMGREYKYLKAREQLRCGYTILQVIKFYLYTRGVDYLWPHWESEKLEESTALKELELCPCEEPTLNKKLNWSLRLRKRDRTSLMIR